jgi:hypothetical protein
MQPSPGRAQVEHFVKRGEYTDHVGRWSGLKSKYPKVKISTVWMNNGTAIQRMVSGLDRITSPLKENSSTRVASNAVIVMGVR